MIKRLSLDNWRKNSSSFELLNTEINIEKKSEIQDSDIEKALKEIKTTGARLLEPDSEPDRHVVD